MFGAIKLEYLAGTESRYRVDQSVGILINNIKMLVMSAFLCQVALSCASQSLGPKY